MPVATQPLSGQPTLPRAGGAPEGCSPAPLSWAFLVLNLNLTFLLGENFKHFFIEVQLTYSVIVSGVQQGDSVICVCVWDMLSCFTCVWPFASLWTVAHQVSLSMGFSRQEYWSGSLCPPPGDLQTCICLHLLHCRQIIYQLSYLGSPSLL